MAATEESRNTGQVAITRFRFIYEVESIFSNQTKDLCSDESHFTSFLPGSGIESRGVVREYKKNIINLCFRFMVKLN